MNDATGKPGLLVLGPYAEEDLAALAQHFTVHRLWQAAERDAFIRQVAPKIRAIGTRGEIGASAELMAQLPALEIVACFGVGTDAIDLAYARSRRIRVTNTPDVLTEDVADLGWALLLATARRIPAGDAHVRSGAWAAHGPMALTTRVWGKRLGIVGLGRIGRAVARRAQGFGMAVAYTGRTRQADLDLDWHADAVSLAAWADMLVVCTAGGAGTQGLVGTAVLEALGPKGIVVNIARGSVVDEAALLHALRTGGIAAAGLDVFLNEPRIDEAFRTLDNVVLQPHHASGTVETRAAMGALVRENLVAHVTGAPLPTPVI
jgi:D-3-phosphoglycerate dehydrogenase